MALSLGKFKEVQYTCLGLLCLAFWVVLFFHTVTPESVSLKAVDCCRIENKTCTIFLSEFFVYIHKVSAVGIFQFFS